MRQASNHYRAYTPEEIAAWISRFRASGLGLHAFAAQHRLSPNRLHYWVYDKRPSKLAKPPAPAPRFQEVKLAVGLPLAEWAAEICLSSGLAVRFSGTAAPAWIGAVVQELRRPC
jgi:hypothetical protein